MPTLTLIRHGKSLWNEQGRFTGWIDIGLAKSGEIESEACAQAIFEHGLHFNAAFSSCLQRSIKTLWIILEKLDLMWLPQTADWRLNERHYGILQGMKKNDAIQKFGDKQVQQWRRGYLDRPPASENTQSQTNVNYPVDYTPLSESLQDTELRISQFITDQLAPSLKAHDSVIICAHGNSLRALRKILEGISDKQIKQIEINTATPIIYQLDRKLNVENVQVLQPKRDAKTPVVNGPD